MQSPESYPQSCWVSPYRFQWACDVRVMKSAGMGKRDCHARVDKLDGPTLGVIQPRQWWIGSKNE